MIREIIGLISKDNENDKDKFRRKLNKKGIKGIQFWKNKSVIDVLKYIKMRNLKNICIINDNSMPVRELKLPELPCNNWDILILGGNVTKILLNNDLTYWIKAEIENYHSVIINGKSTLINNLIRDLYENNNENGFINILNNKDNKYEIYYLRHPIFFNKINPLIKDLSNTPEKLKIITNNELDSSSSSSSSIMQESINDNDLPFVTVLTLTNNRKDIFPLTIRNFYKTNYPKEKLEWIIVDSGISDEDKVRDLLPLDNDKRIKYIECENIGNIESVGGLLNCGISKRDKRSEIIAHLMDNHYYFPNHLIMRIKPLFMDDIECIGITESVIYDFIFKRRYLSKHTDINGHQTIYNLASMVYKNQFWEDENFNDKIVGNLSLSFIKKRFEKCLDIESKEILVGLSSNSNLTLNANKPDYFIETLDEETQEFLMCIKETLKEI